MLTSWVLLCHILSILSDQETFCMLFLRDIHIRNCIISILLFHLPAVIENLTYNSFDRSTYGLSRVWIRNIWMNYPAAELRGITFSPSNPPQEGLQHLVFSVQAPIRGGWGAAFQIEKKQRPHRNIVVRNSFDLKKPTHKIRKMWIITKLILIQRCTSMVRTGMPSLPS